MKLLIRHKQAFLSFRIANHENKFYQIGKNNNLYSTISKTNTKRRPNGISQGLFHKCSSYRFANKLNNSAMNFPEENENLEILLKEYELQGTNSENTEEYLRQKGK